MSISVFNQKPAFNSVITLKVYGCGYFKLHKEVYVGI